MKRNLKYITVGIFIIEIFIGIALFYYADPLFNAVPVKNVYGERQYNPAVLSWKSDQEKNQGVHLYMQNSDPNDPRPLLLYYNGPFLNFINEGIGVITDVQASESNHTLKVKIDEVSFPKASLDNRATAVLMLRKEPEKIEVFLNGEKTEYTLDVGDDPVL